MLEAVHLGAVSLALFLVSATVLGELAAPLFEPVDEAVQQQAEEQLGGFLQAILVHTELAPFHDTNRTDLCSYVRIIETSYRPVLIANRSYAGCEDAEQIKLQFSIAGDARPQVLGARMAICRADSYTITTIRGADRLSGVEAEACKGVGVLKRLETVAGQAPYPFLRGTLVRDPPTEPGLYVACAAALIATPDGNDVVVQDLTWFEVRDAGSVPPRAEGPRQSTAWNTPCADVGVPFDDEVAPWGAPKTWKPGSTTGR